MNWLLYCQGKNSQYPLNRKLDGPQSRSGQFREEKNFLLLETFEPRIIQLIAQSLVPVLTTLSVTLTYNRVRIL